MTDVPSADFPEPQTSGRLSAGFIVACEAGQEVAQARETDQLYRLVDGWAFDARILADGRRQIVSFLLPGDFVNAGAVLGRRDGLPVYALTDLTIAPDRDLATGEALPAVLTQMTRLRDQVVSLGRRTAYERIAAFLLHIAERLDQSRGLAAGQQRYLVPLRLEHLADHLGLSVVHVSRTLRQLREHGLASLYRGELELGDRRVLAQVCEDGARR